MNISLKYMLLLLVLPLSTAWGQQNSVKFDETSFDFGTIREEEGGVTHRFTFTNTGKEVLQIDTVTASCGCTSPDWSPQGVQPGEKGYVEVLYDPFNRGGKFNKSMRVNFKQLSRNIRLDISGFVSPYVADVESRFPVKDGGIRMKQKSLHLGKVINNKTVTQVVEVYNPGEKIRIFADTFQAPEYIRLEFHPETLWPKERGQIHVIYDAQKQEELGFVSDQVKFYTDETQDAEKRLEVMAVVFQYLPPQTPEMLAKAPRIGFSRMSHDFGKVKEGKTYSTTFTLSNFGRSTLNIFQVKANCKCLSVEVPKRTLKAGKNMEVKVTFDAKGRTGTERKEIVVFSNDPKRPVRAFKIEAYVD